MTYEIEKTLVLSTAHLPPKVRYSTLEVLRSQGIVLHEFEYGWVVWVGSNFEGATPQLIAAVRPALELGQRLSCTWVKFDADGPMVSGLASWGD